MKLLNTDQTKWDTNIKLELTLRELQMIRDAMGATNHEIRREIWDEVFTSEDCPYNSEQGTSLFNDIKYILKRQGGVVING